MDRNPQQSVFWCPRPNKFQPMRMAERGHVTQSASSHGRSVARWCYPVEFCIENLVYHSSSQIFWSQQCRRIYCRHNGPGTKITQPGWGWTCRVCMAFTINGKTLLRIRHELSGWILCLIFTRSLVYCNGSNLRCVCFQEGWDCAMEIIDTIR